MAIGRLVHLGSQVTLSTNSSASVNVPNDGSVVAGDLLIAACVMPSGSRTFSISGGGGAWTSLGTASQSGHMSQVWWRLATAGDLGATITITPSTGNIRQVMLLGSVNGVDQTSPVAATSNTSTAATTKTTPSASPSSTVREVGIVWDTRGASTPQTSSWTAPSGHTRQAQAFTTSGSGSCSGAWGDSDTTVSGTIGSRVWTADQSALGSAWTLSVKPGPTIASLTTGTETDTALGLASRVTAAASTANTTEAAQPTAGAKTKATPTASATETTQALAGAKTTALTLADSTESATALAQSKRGTLSNATAVDAPQALTGRKTHSQAPAATSETAQALAGHVIRALGLAVEIDEAIALTTPGRLSLSHEAAQAQPLASGKTALLLAAGTSETAQALTGRKAWTLTQALAPEEARTVTGSKVDQLASANETGTALTLAAGTELPLDITVHLGTITVRWEVSAPWL